VDACGKRATFAHASASRGTPPRRQQMSRQISWLTGRRCCLAFPALMRQWPRSASARRLQLRGQLRPSQSGAPDSLFALALAHCDAREPRRRDYAGAAVIGQRNIKTSLYLRPMHARGLEGDAYGRARATGGKRRQTARYLGHSEAQFRGCELERARYSPRRMRPRRLVRFDCPFSTRRGPELGLVQRRSDPCAIEQSKFD
jgi:hypothetical protein